MYTRSEMFIWIVGGMILALSLISAGIMIWYYSSAWFANKLGDRVRPLPLSQAVLLYIQSLSSTMLVLVALFGLVVLFIQKQEFFWLPVLALLLIPYIWGKRIHRNVWAAVLIAISIPTFLSVREYGWIGYAISIALVFIGMAIISWYWTIRIAVFLSFVGGVYLFMVGEAFHGTMILLVIAFLMLPNLVSLFQNFGEYYVRSDARVVVIRWLAGLGGIALLIQYLLQSEELNYYQAPPMPWWMQVYGVVGVLLIVLFIAAEKVFGRFE